VSPIVSVIIVNYNAGESLSRCVRSIAATDEDLEIIVVDNASGDDSIAGIRTADTGGKHLHIIRNTRNVGFAAACNQGSAAAGGAFFLYLNPDSVVEPVTVPALLHCLRTHPRAGMAGGLILNPDGSEQRGCRRSVPTPWKSLVNSFGLRRLAGLNRKVFNDFRLDREPLPENPVEVDCVSGACMMVSREAFAGVGPMDEGYFLHCEDLDWCMRFRQQGWKVMFVPGARLRHDKGGCSASRPYFVEWSKHKGMVRFFRKFFAADYAKPLQWLILLGIWLRFGLSVARLFVHRLPATGKKSA
jgi:GT2 family glycosyltransferase